MQSANGGVVTRDEDIALFATRAVRPEFIRPRDVKFAVYGATAIVTGVDSLKGTYRGHPSEMALRFTDVLIQREGRWQLVAHQSTPVPAPR